MLRYTIKPHSQGVEWSASLNANKTSKKRIARSKDLVHAILNKVATSNASIQCIQKADSTKTKVKATWPNAEVKEEFRKLEDEWDEWEYRTPYNMHNDLKKEAFRDLLNKANEELKEILENLRTDEETQTSEDVMNKINILTDEIVEIKQQLREIKDEWIQSEVQKRTHIRKHLQDRAFEHLFKKVKKKLQGQLEILRKDEKTQTSEKAMFNINNFAQNLENNQWILYSDLLHME